MSLPFNFDFDREVARFHELAKAYADADATYTWLDSMTKPTYAQCFVSASGDTVKEKEMRAYLASEYVTHIKGVAEARRVRGEALARRNAQERRLEWYRSVLSYKKKEMDFV